MVVPIEKSLFECLNWLCDSCGDSWWRWICCICRCGAEAVPWPWWNGRQRWRSHTLGHLVAAPRIPQRWPKGHYPGWNYRATVRRGRHRTCTYPVFIVLACIVYPNHLILFWQQHHWAWLCVQHTLDLYTSAVLEATLESGYVPEPEFRDLMEEMGASSCKAYRTIVHESSEFDQCAPPPVMFCADTATRSRLESFCFARKYSVRSILQRFYFILKQSSLMPLLSAHR